MWRPRAWQREQVRVMQVGDPVPHEARCIGEEQGALARPLSACPSQRLPAAASAKQHPQVFPVTLGWEDRDRATRSSVVLCLSGANPALPFLPKPLKPVRWEVSPQVAVLWSRTCKQGAGQGGGGCLGGCGCMLVCVCISSLKNLLLVWNSSHVTSAETSVHQRQPWDDKSPERLQRGFWASTSGVPRSISFQVKWKTMTIFFVCEIIKLSFHHCKIPEFPWRKQRPWGWGVRQGRARND